MEKLIARWESKRGAHYVDLFQWEDGYTFYRGNGCSGTLGIDNAAQAIEVLQKKVDSGYFLPDSAKTPMIRKV